jgi:hypothetical protein
MPSFVFKEIKAMIPKFAILHQSHMNCEEAVDGAAVGFPLPITENSVC